MAEESVRLEWLCLGEWLCGREGLCLGGSGSNGSSWRCSAAASGSPMESRTQFCGTDYFESFKQAKWGKWGRRREGYIRSVFGLGLEKGLKCGTRGDCNIRRRLQ